MMTGVRRSTICLIALLAIASLEGPLRAASYPTNTCVGRKQREAGKYCKSALRAWSAWELSQKRYESVLVKFSARGGESQAEIAMIIQRRISDILEGRR